MDNRKESTGNVTILVVVEGTCDTLQTGGPHDISVIFVWSRVENIVEIDKVSTLRMGQRLKTWYNGNGVKVSIEICKVLYLEVLHLHRYGQLHWYWQRYDKFVRQTQTCRL